MIEAIRRGFRNYVNFQGRAGRGDFWWFWLSVVIGNIVAAAIDAMLGLGTSRSFATGNPHGAVAGFTDSNGPVGLIFSLVTFLPLLSAEIRRLHDGNRTGWMILLPVPFVALGVAAMFASGLAGSSVAAIGGGLLLLLGLAAAIALLVFLILPGTPGPNRFGADPRDPQADLEEVFR